MIIWIIIGLLLMIVIFILGHKLGKNQQIKYWTTHKEKEIRADAISRSRAVLAGQFSEQLAPYLPDFPFKPTECRFIGKPIDLIVFKSIDSGNIEKIIFIEIKSGQSKLTSIERKLRDAIKNGKVEWKEYRVPTQLTDPK